MRYTVEGNIVNTIDRSICKGAISVENGIIVEIDYHSVASDNFIMPGFVDAHLHIESTMLTPQNFGELALLRGTMAMVADPHEIANVMGRQGIEFMIESSKKSPIKMFFTIPSCVPVCSFDVSGGVVTADDVEQMAASGRFVALSEVMDINGVITEDKDVMAKIASAKKHGIPIDGHVPVLADDYKKMSQIALHTGCKSHSPFMTLSFMALLVIPEIKIGEKGLFCVSKFNWLDDK